MSCSGYRVDYWCPAWRARARSIRHRDHNRCRDCNCRGKLQVHHLWYGPARGVCGYCRLLNVPDAALLTLCEKCHDKRHGRNLPIFYQTRKRLWLILFCGAAIWLYFKVLHL
jgi:hypothetical protein